MTPTSWCPSRASQPIRGQVRCMDGEIFLIENQTKHSNPPKKFSQPYSQSFSSSHSLKSIHEYLKRLDEFSKWSCKLAFSVADEFLVSKIPTRNGCETLEKAVLKSQLKTRSAWTIYFRFDTSLISSINLTNTDNSSINRFKKGSFILKMFKS